MASPKKVHSYHFRFGRTITLACCRPSMIAPNCPGQPGQQEVCRRTLTIVLGSLVAALLTVGAARAVSWPPPSAHPELAGLYPEDFPVNLNATSFPSQSTALYAAVAAGIYSLRRTLGMWA